MHAGVAIADAVVEASAGRFRNAAAQLFQRSVAQSLRSVVEEAGIIRHLARRRSSPARARPSARQVRTPAQKG
jgi:hypothetical protein